MGGESQRLPALRPSRPDRPGRRFELLFDRRQYEVLPAPQVSEDPLKFRDIKRYTDRIKAARAATGERDALINARGTIEAQAAR